MQNFPQINIEHNLGNTLRIPNLLDIKISTFTNNNVAASATSVPVDNSTGFTSGSSIPLLLGAMGDDNAEITISSAHTINAFTVGALLLNHNRGEIIQQLNYDQIVVYKSATIGGTYIVFSTQTFQVTQQNTVVFDTAGLSTDFYKLQWKNSVSGLVSALSDPISVDTYPEDSVASIVYPVLSAMGISEDDPKINTKFLINAVDDARKFTDGNLYGIRHAWRQEFEHGIKLLSGANFVYLPDDIDFKETDQSLLAARFLIDNVLTPYNLRYIDKRSWNQIAFSVMGSVTVGDLSIGATDIVLKNSGDFLATGGGAFIATTAFNEFFLEINFTSNDKTTNTLHGVTGVTRNIPSGTQVWLRPSIAQPIYYTVYDNKLVFDRIIPNSMQGFNVYIDYYKKLPKVTALTQELPERYRETYKWYLRYAIKYRKDLALPSSDPDLVKFETLVKALFANLYTGQDTAIVQS
ncbi:MAG: hypothetical protein V4509_00710 [Patescibacteria group bacterium]